jgi:hypothetical protein
MNAKQRRAKAMMGRIGEDFVVSRAKRAGNAPCLAMDFRQKGFYPFDLQPGRAKDSIP